MLRTGPNEGRMGWQSDREADPFTESCRTRWSDRSSGAAAVDLSRGDSRGDSRRGPVVRPVASAILYLHSDIAIAISIPPSRCGARYLKLRYAGPVRGLCAYLGGACTQLVSVHAAYHFLGAVPVVHVVDTLVAQGIVSVSSGSLYKLQSEIAVHYAARAGHPAAARSGDPVTSRPTHTTWKSGTAQPVFSWELRAAWLPFVPLLWSRSA